MKKMITFTIVVFFLSGFSFPVMAWHKGKEITPYGDFCRLCGKYGTCGTPMTHDTAKQAVKDYYRKKGLNVMVEKNHGRFIKARVMDKERKVVDVIILDRRTGRIRSIY